MPSGEAAADSFPEPLCPDCGSPALPGQRCGVCQMRHEAQADVQAALTPLPPLMPQYSLATMFFSITWIGICLGALKFNACLGMMLIFLTMPALLRTLALGARDQEEGVFVSPSKRMWVFFASLAIMFVVLVVSGGLLTASAWIALTTASGPHAPNEFQVAGSILAMTFGILGSFLSAAAILWYTRWVGALRSECPPGRE